MSWKGRYRGQKQKWFALRFTGKEAEIDVLKPGGGKFKPEFSDWRWEKLARMPELVVPFKRGVYEEVAAAFRDIAGRLTYLAAERGQHFPELVQSQFRRILRGAVLGVGDVLFGVFDFLGEPVGVHLRQRDRLFGKDGETVCVDVGEAAAHEDAVGLAAAGHVDHPWLHRRHVGSVALHHREIAFGTRHDDFLGLLRHQQLLGRDQFELEGIGHDGYSTFPHIEKIAGTEADHHADGREDRRPETGIVKRRAFADLDRHAAILAGDRHRSATRSVAALHRHVERPGMKSRSPAWAQ